MERIIVTQDNFKNIVNEIYREEQINIVNEKWNSLSESEQKFAIEFLKVIYPEKSKLINEATGWNTFFDFVGIIDPSGMVDFFNGLSYWKQGDKLFAILSWVSVLPVLGDLIAKPVIGLLKVGGSGVKAFRAATLTGDAIKVADAAGKSGGVVAKFVEKSPSWGSKLLGFLNKAGTKYPAIKRLIGLVEEYVKVFVNAGKEMKTGSKLFGKALGNTEKETLKNTFRGFRDYGGFKNKYFKYILSKDVGLWKKFAAGMPHLLGGNPATRSLMRRSKWYLGLLDMLGIVDSKTTPEEILRQYPEQIEEYNQTEMAQKKWSEDFGSGGSEENIEPTKDETTKLSNSFDVNPIDSLIKSVFSFK
jgi:hypothetical protein